MEAGVCVGAVVGVATGSHCLPHGYGEYENAKCIFVPYYNVIVASGRSLPPYLVPTSHQRKVVVPKARKHPATSVVESHSYNRRVTLYLITLKA